MAVGPLGAGPLPYTNRVVSCESVSAFDSGVANPDNGYQPPFLLALFSQVCFSQFFALFCYRYNFSLCFLPKNRLSSPQTT